VQYHLLEATAVHLYFTKGPLGSKDAANGGGEAYGQSNGAAANGNGAGGKPLPAGLSAAARKVHECLRTSPQSNEGLHMQDIAVRLSMDMADVARAGDDLQHNGLIYTTVDDHTWALLEEF
jgi:replication factor A2